MNYDTIILEMLNRIQSLEQQVKSLTEKQRKFEEQIDSEHIVQRIGTKEIRLYIKSLMKSAYENHEEFLVLKANDIHNSLKLKNRMPLVCNAMRQCMKAKDEVIHKTPSGYSSTLEIKYFLKGGVLDD
jgi:hypothetical protein